MCKFCETSKMDEFIVLDDKELSLGVLGKMYGSLKLWNTKSTKAISYDIDTIYSKIVEIKYCPFCGEKLESE